MEIKGVNLGNWLVLEKWMNPSLFEGTDAEDEYWLPRRLSREVYEARIKTHRNEYINERDFVTIKSWGLDTIRIPVPYFIFGDREPFVGCIAELDKAFLWAEKYELKILIDLHTAPMGQNGFDNGGICGVLKWAQLPEEVEFVHTVLERLCERYGNREGLWGVQVLNEPILEDGPLTLEFVQEKYAPVDIEQAKGSKTISVEFLREFYLEAYERMRKFLPDDKYFVIHDGFRFTSWKDFMQESKYKNVVLDTHQYLMHLTYDGFEQTLDSYKNYIENEIKPAIAEMSKYFLVVCGEWCLSNPLTARNDMDDESKRHIYNELQKAQIDAWSPGNGYFYWSYKLLIDTLEENSWPGRDSWDLGRCVGLGWFNLEDK